MSLKLALGIASSVLVISSFAPYIRDIVKKQTQPHIYSWLVWAILQVIGATAQFKDGAGYGAWAIAIGALLCFSIFLLSFWYGTKNITKFDGFCLAASLLIIVIYFATKNLLWSVLLVVIVDFIGYLPTFRKTYQEPFTETSSTYILSALSQLLAIFAIQHFSTITAIYPTTLFLTDSAFVMMILSRQKVLAKV